jgi:hypothetical protein
VKVSELSIALLPLLKSNSNLSFLAIEISEQAVPVREDVGSACEVLGLDPFHIANEGRFVAFVPAVEAARAIELVRPRSARSKPARRARSPARARSADAAHLLDFRHLMAGSDILPTAPRQRYRSGRLGNLSSSLCDEDLD